MRSAHPSAPLTGPDAPSPLENFLDLHARKVVVGLALVLALVAVFTTIHLKKKNFAKEAGSALVVAADIDALQKVIANYPGTPAGQTASLLLADRQMAAGDAQGAAGTLRGFLAANAEHPLTSQARVALATALLRLGTPEEANAELAAFVQASPTSPLAPLALMMQAQIAEKKGDIDGARKLYQDVKSGFQDSQFARQAGRQLDRVGFVMPAEVEPAPPPPAPEDPVEPAESLPAGGPTPLLDSDAPLPIPGAQAPAVPTMPPVEGDVGPAAAVPTPAATPADVIPPIPISPNNP